MQSVNAIVGMPGILPAGMTPDSAKAALAVC